MVCIYDDCIGCGLKTHCSCVSFRRLCPPEVESSVGCSADPRLLGALRKTVSGWGGGMRMDEMHLSVFHSVSNRAHGKRSRNSISSAARISSRFFFFFFK